MFLTISLILPWSPDTRYVKVFDVWPNVWVEFTDVLQLFNPNQLSPGQKCPGDNFFFNALFVSEHFKHFEIYLFLTHFGE